MTDPELIEGILRRDRYAFQCLVERYQKQVIKTACYFVGNMEDAEDLSQEVFLEILRSINRYKKGSTLSTWIYRITVNKSLDHLRKQQRRSFVQKMGTMLRISPDGMSLEENEPVALDTRNDDNEKKKSLIMLSIHCLRIRK